MVPFNNNNINNENLININWVKNNKNIPAGIQTNLSYQ